ncbi:glutamate racemase [bacterium]|mgnify:CR=1 FL=1|nr:MAG: glutamate racemase [bacterium]
MRKSTDPIGVFDSGIGGLTVVREIMRELPDESIIYFGDTARVPYGTKSKETIEKFAVEDVEFLLKFNVKIIVSACFTVSSNAMDVLRGKFNIPIFDMIEPGVRAVKRTGKRRIGIIGTYATIESRAYEKRIREEVPDAEIFTRPAPLFVPLAEEGKTRGKIAELVVEEYLKELKGRVEVLVLGCTHYPLLKETIKDFMEEVILVEPGKEVAGMLKEYLGKEGLLSSGPPRYSFYLSDIPRKFGEIGERFLGRKLEGIRVVREWIT